MKEIRMTLLIRNFLLFIILVQSSLCHASLVDYFKVQHAGEIGYYAIGVGNNVSKRYSFELFYGYVPKDIGGIDINTFSMKNNLTIFSINLLSFLNELYTGLNLYHVTGMNYQTSRKSSYPRDYYGGGSVRGQIYMGMNFSSNKFKRHRFYFESGLNDIVLINYYNNPGIINPFNYVSLALGYSCHF